MEKEIWKDIKGYEGRYQINQFGKARSLTIEVNSGYGSKRNVIGKILKEGLAGNGYYTVSLRNNNKSRTFTIHSLVANHFIDNPNKYRTVDHIDGGRTNNYYKNLEWVTHKENTRRAIVSGAFNPKRRKGIKSPSKKSRKIISINLITKEEIEWRYMRDACEGLSLNKSCVYGCLQGKQKRTKTYSFRYA